MSDIYTPYISDQSQKDILDIKMRGLMKYTLMNDFLSKYGFQKDLYALAGLLAALLQIDVSEITNIEILNPIEPADAVTDKNCILDIKLELNHSSIINIEIQSRHQDFWPERSITYLCRCFDQLKSGESYESIKPCIHIGILDNDLFQPNDPRYTGEFYTEYQILNCKHYTEYSSKFIIRVLSLNHLEDANDIDKKDKNSLYYWAKLFRATSWEEVDMITEDNERMQSLTYTVKQLSADRSVAEACEARRRYSNDIATYEGQIARTKAEAERAQAEADKAKAEADKAKADADKAKADADKAKADKAKAEADKAKAEADKAKAEAEVQNLKSEVSQLQEEMTELKDLIKSFTKK